MQLRVIILFIAVAIACNLSWADTIHLKNGRTIVADHIRENGTHLEYDIGDDSYAISKTSVDHVDAGGMPSVASGGGAKVADLPAFTPQDSLANEGDLVSRIVKEGKVNPEVLASLEQKGNPELSATADFIAGKFEFEHGNIAQSRQYFESALRFQPDNSTILIYYAALLVRTGNAAQALPYAQSATRAAPNSPDAYTMLGYAQFASDRTKEAVASWKRSLELRPDAKVEQFLAKAQREQKVESDFTQGESSHFVLHYEGRQTSEALRGQILAALESDYDDLVRDLGNPPRDSILVTLYTEQAFFDVTHAPTWSGAINDGKLRIPVSGVASVTPELARVLKHELTHSFVSQMSSNRCPTWLNEGIAQMEEGKSSAPNGHQLAQLFAAGNEIPFNLLEGSFMSFSAPEATVAYAESLAAVEYLRDAYGMTEITSILERLSQGSSTEAALRATVHSDYRQLRDEMTRKLKERYGE